MANTGEGLSWEDRKPISSLDPEGRDFFLHSPKDFLTFLKEAGAFGVLHFESLTTINDKGNGRVGIIALWKKRESQK